MQKVRPGSSWGAPGPFPAAALALFAALALGAGVAAACPLCMNSDPALSNPGSGSSGAGQWRVTVENKSLSKLNGIVQDGAPRGTDTEFQHENRLAGTFAYQPTMRLNLALTVPFMSRAHTQFTTLDNSQTKATHFGDADLQARYQFWIHPTGGYYVSVSAMGALVAPTGQNNATVGSARLSEHNQPGTGAWAAMAGGSLQLQNASRWGYLGAIYKKTWQNQYHYDYGAAEMLTLELGQRATSRLSVIGTGVYRSTATEIANDPGASIYQVQTGGDILLLGGGLQVTPMEHVSVRGVAYVPVVNGFNQPQSEDNSLSFSVSYSH